MLRKKRMGSSNISLASIPTPSREGLMKWGKSFMVPYYLTIVAALGAATVGFLVVIALLILVAANFNVLGLIE